MTKAVLDASAVLALLKGERGGTKVAGVVADAGINVVNQAELVSHFLRLGAPLEEIRSMLGALPMVVHPADEALAWEAGALRAESAEPGLSLGGSFCLALAKRLGCPAWTADPAWKSLALPAGVKITLIR